MNLVFCWGKNTCFTKELDIKWHFPVFTVWSYTELFSWKRINFALAVIFYTFFDLWLYKCKYDCKMITNMCKWRLLSWRWRTFNFCFKDKYLLSVGTMQVPQLQSLCKQFRELKDVGCLRKNKSEWTCPKNGHHRCVRTLFIYHDCLGLLGFTSLWASWPGFQIPLSFSLINQV